MEDPNCKKRVRDDDSDESVHESAEVKRLRVDLLEFLGDADPTPLTQDLDSVMNLTQDLDSVMKSLQEEISASSSPASLVTSDSGESQPQIGYLLEASDDELGLPPPGESSAPEGKGEEINELIRVSSDSSGIGEFWGFEDHIPSYDSFDLGTGVDYYNSNTEYYDSFDGLFDHSDVYYDSTEFSESLRHETLPAQ